MQDTSKENHPSLKVLLLSRYGQLGASSRMRSYQYLKYLEDHDVKVTVAPLFGDDYLLKLYRTKESKALSLSTNVSQSNVPLSMFDKNVFSVVSSYLARLNQLLRVCAFDLVWIEKELFPWIPAWAEQVLSLVRIPYIVDYDDAIFHRYDKNSSFAVRSLLGGKIDLIMRKSALVIAGNNYLAERASASGAKNVKILPTVVDLTKYQLKPHRPNAVTTIGWIGSPSTACYLSNVKGPLQQICKKFNARLALVGSGQLDFGDMRVDFLPWSEDTEVELIRSFDIGIMPLTDEPFERGKCGYKIIQYMACCKPVIASPVGVNNTIIDHGINGYLAGSAADWGRSLSSLIENPSLSAKFVTAGRVKVESCYSFQITAPLLLEMLFDTAKRSSRTWMRQDFQRS